MLKSSDIISCVESCDCITAISTITKSSKEDIHAAILNARAGQKYKVADFIEYVSRDKK